MAWYAMEHAPRSTSVRSCHHNATTEIVVAPTLSQNQQAAG